jgi:catechol 2,3-dioxygenase-like lactoylglutathione lyase family enzyme
MSVNRGKPLKIRHVSTIVFVSDVARSTAFYRDVLGQPVSQDFGTIVMFEHGFSIHDGVNLLEKTYKTPGAFPQGPQGKDNIDIYFETDDLEAAYRAVVDSGANVIHPIETQAWGQRVFRFHDPDGHIVEIGDPM